MHARELFLQRLRREEVPTAVDARARLTARDATLDGSNVATWAQGLAVRLVHPVAGRSSHARLELVHDEVGEGNPIAEIYNLTAGKYDLTVSSGPSFTTRREEAAFQMTEFVRAFPAAAPVIGDLLAKNLDWPGADEIAERLKSVNPALQQQNQGIPPEVQQMIEQGQQAIQQLQQEVEALKADKSIDQQNADTERMKVMGDLQNDRAKIELDAQVKVAGAAISARQKAEASTQNPMRQG